MIKYIYIMARFLVGVAELAELSQTPPGPPTGGGGQISSVHNVKGASCSSIIMATCSGNKKCLKTKMFTQFKINYLSAKLNV